MSQSIAILANQLCQQAIIQERQFKLLQQSYDKAQLEIADLKQLKFKIDPTISQSISTLAVVTSEDQIHHLQQYPWY